MVTEERPKIFEGKKETISAYQTELFNFFRDALVLKKVMPKSSVGSFRTHSLPKIGTSGKWTFERFWLALMDQKLRFSADG